MTICDFPVSDRYCVTVTNSSAQTPLLRFVANLLYSLLWTCCGLVEQIYKKSATKPAIVHSNFPPVPLPGELDKTALSKSLILAH